MRKFAHFEIAFLIANALVFVGLGFNDCQIYRILQKRTFFFKKWPFLH